MQFPKSELENLWAPWRAEYFEGKIDSRDFLSKAAQAQDDAAHLVLSRGPHCFLIMNRYPYTVGHLMVAPLRKVAEIGGLHPDEIQDLFALLTHAQNVLRATLKAQGFNIGINVGECAGAGVPDHLHVHVVPRWEGDTNFMPMLSGPRVLSESLAALYGRLLAAQRTLPAHPNP
ncbi:MAG: HIT domain-containing protein [Verrucomicrobiota bacterium]